jgi:hypothetical protein
VKDGERRIGWVLEGRISLCAKSPEAAGAAGGIGTEHKRTLVPEVDSLHLAQVAQALSARAVPMLEREPSALVNLVNLPGAITMRAIWTHFSI